MKLHTLLLRPYSVPGTMPGTEDTKMGRDKARITTLSYDQSPDRPNNSGVGERNTGAVDSVFGEQKKHPRGGVIWPAACR